MKNCVYIHRTPVNKAYIGITCKNPEYRWANGKGYANNSHFNKAIKKYGWDNIEHIIFADNLSKEEACKIEKLLISTFETNNPLYGYNIINGGEFFNHSEESKIKMSLLKKGKYDGVNNPNYGKHFTEESKLKISLANKGRKLTEEQRLNISKGHIGIPSKCKGKVRTTVTKNSRLITINDETKPLSVWCDIYKVNYHTVQDRIRRGWKLDETLFIKANTKFNGKRGVIK